MNIDNTIFRTNDIRGEVDKNFTPEVVKVIGRAYAIYLKIKFRGKSLTVSVGRDIRLHSEKLKDALISGILSEGVNVINLGVCPTPVLYFSLFNLSVDGGIMITGSHNPPEFNGMKVCIGKETIYGEEIQKIYKITQSFPLITEDKKGKLRNFNILLKYRNFLLNEFKGIKKFKNSISIAIDSGNGCAGTIVPQVLRKLGVKVFELYSEPDGNFPNHHPDPTLIETLDTLKDTVKNNNLDFGIAYDGDVDRLGVIDGRGELVYGDKLLYIFAKDVLTHHPGGKIIGEVKCSRTLFDGIKELGGIPVISPVGHSLIKKKIKEEEALLAGEMSGHMFFSDKYFGFDDAIYATLRLIEIFAKEKIKNNNFKFSDLLKNLPKMYASPEIRITCKDEEKFALIEQFLAKYKEKFPDLAQKIKKTITIDGVRIEFSDGWGLIRASNTEPVLVMRFEAITKEALKKYEKSFKITVLK